MSHHAGGEREQRKLALTILATGKKLGRTRFAWDVPAGWAVPVRTGTTEISNVPVRTGTAQPAGLSQLGLGCPTWLGCPSSAWVVPLGWVVPVRLGLSQLVRLRGKPGPYPVGTLFFSLLSSPHLTLSPHSPSSLFKLSGSTCCATPRLPGRRCALPNATMLERLRECPHCSASSCASISLSFLS